MSVISVLFRNFHALISDVIIRKNKLGEFRGSNFPRKGWLPYIKQKASPANCWSKTKLIIINANAGDA